MARAQAGRATAVLVGLLLLPSAARADYKETYRKGIEALDRKRWPEVARLMREAIAENPREGERIKLYGLRFEAYVPHFWLGVGLAETGDCEGALRAFDASEAAGAIRSTPHYSAMLNARKTCASRVAKAATPPPAPAPAPATQPPAAPQPAKTAEDSRVAAARDEAALKATAQASPVPSPSPGSPSPAAPEPPGVPAGLLKAARAYFDGRYEESLTLLGRAVDLRGRAAAQSHLFRAAARFALYRVGREQDASLRDLAARDVVACRRADASLAPDAQAFSPAFAEFFRRSR
jgi:hypothetical protein